MTIVIDIPMLARVALVVLGLALIFSCLCRAKHMTSDGTVSAIRYSTTALASAGFVVLLSALARPDWLLGALIAVAGAALAVQVVSARYWRRGLPEQFRSRA